MSKSIFMPVVTVHDDGLITFNWGDSYVQTEHDDGTVTSDGNLEHGLKLDDALGLWSDLSDADRLQRLVDTMRMTAVEQEV